jgi:hypothetical protein
MEENEPKKMSLRNKLQAFLLLPLLLGTTASLLYTLISLFTPNTEGIRFIYAFSFVICFAYVPLLGLHNFRKMFVDQHDSLIQKIRRNEEEMKGYGIIVIFLVLVAIFLRGI